MKENNAGNYEQKRCFECGSSDIEFIKIIEVPEYEFGIQVVIINGKFARTKHKGVYRCRTCKGFSGLT